MILVDKDIKKLGSTLIVDFYSEDNIGAVSYDLTADIYFKSSEKDSNKQYVLKPNEFIIVKTKEKLKMPNDLLGIIAEKNSLIRLGLMVSGPRYQPGHETYIYLRVLNISDKNIVLKENLNIAHIFFETLADIPNKTYNQQNRASFNDEVNYKGFGKYDKEYKEMMDNKNL